MNAAADRAGREARSDRARSWRTAEENRKKPIARDCALDDGDDAWFRRPASGGMRGSAARHGRARRAAERPADGGSGRARRGGGGRRCRRAGRVAAADRRADVGRAAPEDARGDAEALGGKNMQDLTPEERQKLLAKVREADAGGAAKKSDDTKGESQAGRRRRRVPLRRGDGLRRGRTAGSGGGRRGGGADLPPVMGATAAPPVRRRTWRTPSCRRLPSEDSTAGCAAAPGPAGRCRDHRRENSERDPRSQPGGLREGRQARRLREGREQIRAAGGADLRSAASR